MNQNSPSARFFLSLRRYVDHVEMTRMPYKKTLAMNEAFSDCFSLRRIGDQGDFEIAVDDALFDLITSQSPKAIILHKAVSGFFIVFESEADVIYALLVPSRRPRRDLLLTKKQTHINMVAAATKRHTKIELHTAASLFWESMP